MLKVNNLVGFGAGGGDPFAGTFSQTLSYEDEDVDATNQASSYTFSTKSIGTAAASRVVIVAVALSDQNADNPIDGVTLDGTSMTEEALYDIPISNSQDDTYLGIYSLKVSSGTAAEFIVSFSGGTCAGCSICVWSTTGTGWDNRSKETQTDDGNSSAATITLTGGTPGIGVMIAWSNESGDISYSGTATVTTRTNNWIDSDFNHRPAYCSDTSGTVSVDSGGTADNGIVAVYWT